MLGALLDQEDIRWKQQAKRRWLVGGDMNIRFYHAYMNQRRKKNEIKRIIDNEGNELTDKEEVVIGF